jgi:hypothetical protein
LRNTSTLIRPKSTNHAKYPHDTTHQGGVPPPKVKVQGAYI